MKSALRFFATPPLFATTALLATLAPPALGQSERSMAPDTDLPVVAITAHGLREILRIDARSPAQAHSLLSVFIAEDVGPRHLLEGEPLDIQAQGGVDATEIRSACLVSTDGPRRVLDLRRTMDPEPTLGVDPTTQRGAAAPEVIRCFEIVARDLRASAFRRPAVRMYGAGNVIFSSADYQRFSRRVLDDLQAQTEILRPFRPQTVEERIGAPVEIRVVVAEVRGDAWALLFRGR